MKKTVSLLAAILLVTLLFPVTAFARGHCGGAVRTGYALCTVENCDRTYSHRHDGIRYGGHYNGDGHSYHSFGHRGRHH